MDFNRLKQDILALIDASALRMTSQALEKEVRAMAPGTRRPEIRAAIAALLAQGVIRYTQRYGMTQLERNYERPQQLSERLWLVPPDQMPDIPPGGSMIRLAAGAAFGGGDHPTTRLALQALDRAVSRFDAAGLGSSCALDVGTGSGVLAIAAVLLGFGTALALDIDQVACHEARANVRLNGLETRIAVSEQPLETLTGPRFDLVLANLRPPTLKALFPHLHRITCEDGLWVLSGFRPEEMASLRPAIVQGGSAIIWESTAGNWSTCLIHHHTR